MINIYGCASGPITTFFVALVCVVNAFTVPQLFVPVQRHQTTITPSSDVSIRMVASSSDELVSSSKSQASSQNIFGTLSDTFTGVVFSLLHAFDDCGIEDSSKNLRVLWVRALLNFRNEINDDVASTLLPSNTRTLVTSEWGAKALDPILPFAEWIKSRTDFIDTGLDYYLSSPLCTDQTTGIKLECNIVLMGAGYDTRVLRYRHKHGYKANFIEVDLPSVVEGKAKLYKKFQKEQDPDWDLDKYGSTLVPFDLNDAGGSNPRSLIETLRETGALKKDVPTLFVSEAVLFYVNEDAVSNIMNEFFDFANGGNGESPKAETLFCFTDSLKPFLDVPFSNEARKWFDKNNMDLLQHRSRWGGAVHFALATSRSKHVVDEESKFNSVIGTHIHKQVGGLVNSYIPTASRNKDILKTPSFENAWYAVSFPWQIDGYDTPLDAALKRKSTGNKGGEVKPFATRLWGEPIVIYRDSQNELVAMADVCPHRSAPLSMGKIEDGKLHCLYHGWEYGEKGACVNIPTLHSVEDESGNDHSKVHDRVTNANRGNMRAVVEHQGLVYVWRGNILEANPELLPSRREGDMETVPIDTVLDYDVDYSYIIENNLDSPHLFYLHDGSVPPIASIGMKHENLPKLKLTAFTDDCGMGHLGKLGSGGRPKKLLRFDPPNVVRHGGVSGFEEEFHCVPIAPQRTRVLLRQHLPRGPILSTITRLPGLLPVLTLVVNMWNYQIALEDGNVMQGQANRIEDWGAPRLSVGGLGDDLIMRYWTWRRKAHNNLKLEYDKDSPYHVTFSGVLQNPSIPTGTAFGDDPVLVSKVNTNAQARNTPLVTDSGETDAFGKAVGSWGIKQDYIQELPAANFPPINYKPYARMLVFDDLVKNIVMKRDEDVPDVERIMRKESIASRSPAIIE